MQGAVVSPASHTFPLWHVHGERARNVPLWYRGACQPCSDSHYPWAVLLPLQRSIPTSQRQEMRTRLFGKHSLPGEDLQEWRDLGTLCP
jgi:hypothetical protein